MSYRLISVLMAACFGLMVYVQCRYYQWKTDQAEQALATVTAERDRAQSGLRQYMTRLRIMQTITEANRHVRQQNLRESEERQTAVAQTLQGQPCAAVGVPVDAAARLLSHARELRERATGSAATQSAG